jgi:nucleoside diphosphate kinase
MYGTDITANVVHASSNAERAMEEVKVAFPDIEFNADGTPRSM